MAQHMLVGVASRSRVGVSARLAGMLIVAIFLALAALATLTASAWIAFGLSHS
jgi:hypothetical protein